MSASGRFSKEIRSYILAIAVLFGASSCSARKPCHVDPELSLQVESVRGLAFSEPVNCVRRKPSEAARDFSRSLLRENEDAELQNEEQLLQALAFIPPDYRYSDSLVRRSAEAAGAYYDPREKRIVVISFTSRPSSFHERLIVHELTHALQDQHFSLLSLAEESETMDREKMRLALLEGDANAVTLILSGGLDCNIGWEDIVKDFETRKKRASIFEEPPALALLRGASYSLGLRYVCSLLERGGFEAVNQALQSLPRSSSVLFNDQPSAEEGDLLQCSAGQESLGPLAGFALLASAGDITASLMAVRGWRGDCAEKLGDRRYSWRVKFTEGHSAAEFAERLRAVFAGKDRAFRRRVEADSNEVRVLAY